VRSQPRRTAAALLLAAAIALYFVDLGGSSIWDANEAFYTETPREMIERGDYVSPTFNYEPRLNKPVLSYWIVAGFYRLFGVSVGVQRLAIALGAVVLVVVGSLLASTAWPARLPVAGARSAALWAAVGLAVSPRHVMFARRIFVDIYISMFMALTLLFFALAERHPGRRRTFLLLMYVSVGAGVLTKGPVAALLPGLVFALYLAVHREVRRARDMMMPSGMAIVLAMVVPWYAAQYQRYGWTYIVSFFLGENLARYTDGLGVNADRPFWFYLPVVFSDAFPWSVLIVAAAALWLRDRRGPADPSHRILTLLWIWVIVIVAFFSASTAKQDLYIYPVVPAIAALAGVTIARQLHGDPSSPRRLAGLSLALGGLVLIVLGAGVLYLLAGAGAVYALHGVVGIGVLALAGGAATILMAAARGPSAALTVLCATLTAVNWLFVVRTLPSFEAYKPVPGFARVLRERAAPEDVVASFNVAVPSLVFYLQRHVDMAYDPAPIRVFLDGRQTAYVIMSRDAYALIDAATDQPTCIIHTQPTFNVKLRDILARSPVPDLVLVTNRCG
jgi:4-amino-4-deoxy-L-arabinose transferase-like glycosyltransferase